MIRDFLELDRRLRALMQISLLNYLQGQGWQPARRLTRGRLMGLLLKDVTNFYQVQLHRHSEAIEYLQQRGINQPQVIDELGIGYAPGHCLRHWLMTMG